LKEYIDHDSDDNDRHGGNVMLSEQKKEVLRLYNLGLNSYKLRKWDESIKLFSDVLRVDPKDGPSALYLERAKAYKLNPPADDWDGVFVMTTK
jgi:tetratricopeptide (TPR) repeat protein